MGAQTEIYIVGFGAQTPLGRDAAASATAVQARLSGRAEHPTMIDEAGHPMVVGRAPWLPEDTGWGERLAALAWEAALEAISPLAAAEQPPRTSLFLALPSPRPGGGDEALAAVLEQVRAVAHPRLSVLDAVALASGHAAGLTAVHQACLRLRAGDCDLCLVGGVDSYLTPETLEWLDATGRLHAPANSWGLVPGEAAAFCLLAGKKTAQRLGLPLRGEVVSAATGRARHWSPNELHLGEGLTETFHRALAALPAEQLIDETICDLNGDPDRANDFGFAVVRTGRRFRSPGKFRAPASHFGDVGAASGPLFVALAVLAAEADHAAGPYTLVSTSSEAGEHSAAVVRCEPAADVEEV